MEFYSPFFVRFDFIYNTDHGELFFLEVNTIPGQSAESIVSKQARCVGISTSELYDMIIGMKRMH
ncbi:MAG: hypothetical protein IJ620_02700 [Bacteroidales bacterium]|nr:hypothetical protein [Bacteroidales bacterium]